jgi:peptide deformylase
MWRVIVVDVTGHKKAKSCHGLMVLFNPEILAVDGSEVAREGCLSLPDFTANVSRATHAVIAGTTPDGSHRVIEADAFEARALLHEMDHLDGLLFLDRVTSRQTDVFQRKRYQ